MAKNLPEPAHTRNSPTPQAPTASFAADVNQLPVPGPEQAATYEPPCSRAISSRIPPVAVEFDSRGRRARKVFINPSKARRFYAQKLSAGKNPAVRKVN
jgi:hypothetical protein